MSTPTSNMTKAAALAQLQALITGLQKHNPSGTFLLGNVTYTTAELVTLLQGAIDAITKVNAAELSARDAVSAMNAVFAQGNPVFRALKRNLRNAYGTASQTLADYGLEPEKARTPLTGQALVAASAKAKATREARGTGSKKSKSTVSGNVTGVTVTPTTVVPAPSSPTAQPAPATPGAPNPGASK